MLPVIAPPLVQRIQSDFLAAVRAELSTCSFLSDASHDEVGRLIAEKAPVRAVGDALFRGFVGDWAARRQKVAHCLGATPQPFGPHECSAARLFEDMPAAEMIFGSVTADRRDDFLRVLTEAGFGADRVLEFGYSESVSDAVVLSGEDQLDTIHSDLCRTGMAVYACDDDGLLTLRVPSLTAFEAGLGVFFAKKAARFCLAPALIPRPELNELHRMGWHAIALPMRATPVHRADAEHPAEVALHDASHTYLWPAPWLRHSGVLLFDAIEATVPEGERDAIDEQEMLLTDLAFRNVSDLCAIVQSLASRLSRGSKTRAFEDYSGRLNGFFGESHSSGLAVLKACLRTHLI